MKTERLSLAVIINRFWAGTGVRWSAQADRQLQFWSGVHFESLSAPISADVIGVSIEQAFWYPERFYQRHVSFLFQDASQTAAGGGIMHMRGSELVPSDEMFLAEFSQAQQ